MKQCVDIFKVNILSEKLGLLTSPNMQDVYWEVSFTGTEISLILKIKMAVLGISLRIIYLFYWLVLETRRFNLFIGHMHNWYPSPLQAWIYWPWSFSFKVIHRESKYPTYRTLKVSMIGPRGLPYKANYVGNHGQISLVPLLQGNTRIVKPESAYISLIIGSRGLECDTTSRKSWTRNPSSAFRFDLGSLLQGLKIFYLSSMNGM